MAARTNTISVSYVEEASSGVLPGSPVWKYIQPDDVSTFGATTTTKSRTPISDTRGAKKGAIIDIDSAVEFPCNLTMDSYKDFAKGFMFANWNAQLNFEPTAVSTSAYTVSASGDLTAGTLVFARDFRDSDNNGLKVVDTGSTATSIVVVETLVVESTPPDDAEVDVVGVQGASADIEFDASGDLISTVLDFTTLGLVQGQGIYIGGSTEGTSFATAADKGYARCKLIEAHKITLDKKSNTFVVDAGTDKTIQIFIGSFIRDVATSDADFAMQTYQFELQIPGLTGGTAYEYSKGNLCNTANFNLATSDFANMNFGFIGTDTDIPTTSRASGTWMTPNKVDAMSTTANIVKLRVATSDETLLTTYTKSLDIAINNNISPEKVVGVLGAVDMGYGEFTITGSTEMLFEDSNIVAAIRDNETVTMDFVTKNDDGAIWIDIPSMTFGSGNKSLPRNEIIKIAIDGNAFEDSYYGFSLGTTWFPYIPA